MLCEFVVKTPIHAPFGGVIGDKMGEMETFINFTLLGMQ